MKDIFQYLLSSIIPLIIVFIVIYGIIKKVKVYEVFVEGAKDGIKICIKIFPSLLAILIGIRIFRDSKMLEYMINLLNPLVRKMGIPPEVMPLILIKPLSGSGALGIFTDIIKQYGPDTIIGLIASIIMGSTETIFYTLTVYYGSVKVKKIRYTLFAAIIADIVAILMAVTLVNLWFR